MTTFILNLTRHYNDLSVAEPFWYDLFAKESLFLTKTSSSSTLGRIEQGLQVIKAQLGFTRSWQWQLVVFVEMVKDKNLTPYTAGIQAKWLAVQDGLQKAVNNSNMRQPETIIFIWLDTDNDEFIRYDKDSLLGQSIDFDKKGFIASNTNRRFFTTSFFENLDQQWQKAKITTKGQNIGDLSMALKTKVQQLLNNIENQINTVLEDTYPEDFELEGKMSAIPEYRIKAIRQAVKEELAHTFHNPGEWNRFLPSRTLKMVLQQQCSLFAAPVLQKTLFLRLSFRHIVYDMVRMAFLVRLIVHFGKKIVQPLQKEKMPFWEITDINRHQLDLMLNGYSAGLKEAERELEQLKNAQSQIPFRIKQYRQPAFVPTDASQLPDFKIIPFSFTWFNDVSTLPKFLNWLYILDKNLHHTSDAIPSLIEKCHQSNRRKKMEEQTEEWTEQQMKEALQQRKKAYDKAQNILNNALQNQPIFQEWNELKKEKELAAKDQFGKRPSFTVFFAIPLLTIICLVIPYLMGWWYVQEELALWTSGIGWLLISFFAIWLLWRIVRPIKQLVKDLVEKAKDTKKNIQQEVKKQEYYIQNIIESHVLRRNIQELEKTLDKIANEKQLLEYHLKETDNHTLMIKNLMSQLKISKTHSPEYVNVSIKKEQLAQAFYKNNFTSPFYYFKTKDKLDISVANTPVHLADYDVMGSLVKEMVFQEDRVV